MVQFKDVFTGAETRSYTPGGRLPARPAGRRQAQRLRGGRPDHPPPHVLRDARQLELRRLLQARGHPLRLGVPDRSTWRSRPSGWPPRPTRTTMSPVRSGATRSACRRSGWPCGAMSRPATTATSGGWPRPARAGRAARSISIAGASCREGPECVPDHSETCPRWLELWNLVFMEFDQRPAGRVPLPFPSVDTGLGLERLASVLQQVPSNFDTDLFTPIHARMRELLGHDPDAFEAERFSYQVIADHSRAITFLIADGVLPSNEGRGYVLRRIVRRAVRHGRLLGRTRAVPGRDRRGRDRDDAGGLSVPRRAARRRSWPRSPARRSSSPGPSMPARSTSRRR